MSSVKNEIVKGVFWIALAKYSGVFISLAVTAVLARNVSPSAFGTMAIANVVISFIGIFVDMGIGVAVVQFKDLTKRQLDTLFTLGLYLGIFLAAILFVTSGWISGYYNDSLITGICRILCIAVLLNALNIVPNGLMMRHKRFRAVAIRSLFFQLLCGGLAIWAALAGWGIYALLVTPILSPVGVLIYNLCNYPCRLIMRLDTDVIRKVWKYSSFQFLFSFINYFSRNIDTLIIGKYFSMSQLGYYDKAYRLMQMPLQYITFVIGPVLHPILSDLQSDAQSLAVKAMRLITIMSRISFPIGIVCYFCASPIIDIIFGPNWQPAVPVFQILALSLPLQMILSLSGALFQAAGRTDHMFYTGTINTILTIAGFFIAAFCFRTLESMAWAWDITLTINFMTSYITMFRLTFRSDVRKLWTALWPQIVNSAGAVALMIVITRLTAGLNEYVYFALSIALISITTLAMALLLHQYSVRQLMKSVVKR